MTIQMKYQTFIYKKWKKSVIVCCNCDLLGNFSCFSFFSKLSFSKIHFRNTIKMSNSLDADQDRQTVGPDLGPNCLQRLSEVDKNRGWQAKS